MMGGREGGCLGVHEGGFRGRVMGEGGSEGKEEEEEQEEEQLREEEGRECMEWKGISVE